MIAFQTSVRINRPIEEVFAYVSDPLNLPRWNSAVQSVEETSTSDNGAGATYSMVRVLPTGPAVNRLEVVARERPSDFTVRAGAGPTPFLYRYRLSAENEATLLHLRAEVELPAIPALLAPVARRGVRKGVEDNFAALKALLEVRP